MSKSKLIASRLVLKNGKHAGATCKDCIKLLNIIADMRKLRDSVTESPEDQVRELTSLLYKK
jgi:hypothetical protein